MAPQTIRKPDNYYNYSDKPFDLWYKENLSNHRYNKLSEVYERELGKHHEESELFEVYKRVNPDKMIFNNWIDKYGRKLCGAKLRGDYYDSDEEKSNMKLEYNKYLNANKYMRSIIKENETDQFYLLKLIEGFYALANKERVIHSVMLKDEIYKRTVESHNLITVLLNDRKQLDLVIKSFEENSHICEDVTTTHDKLLFIINKCGELEHEKMHLKQYINEQEEELEKIRIELLQVEKLAFERKDRMVVRMKQLQVLIDEI